MKPSTMFALTLIASAGCMDSQTNSYDVVLGGDSKADTFAGKQVSFVISESMPWFGQKPVYQTQVRQRVEDKLVLTVQSALFYTVSGGAPNYTSNDILSIEIAPAQDNVALGFAFYDAIEETKDEMTLYTCAGHNLFTKVELDFAQAQMSINGTNTYSFAECGVNLAAGDEAAVSKQWFGAIAIPIATPDGTEFSGTYLSSYDVQVH
jgi:hypothetical protein